MEKSNAQLYEERKQRVQDAIALKVPDRVPIWFQDASFFPARYTGMTFREAMFESDKIFAAYKETFMYYEPDVYFNPGHALHTPGKALETLDCKQILVPGQAGISENHSFFSLLCDFCPIRRWLPARLCRAGTGRICRICSCMRRSAFFCV